jgi:hypothetical protein
MVSGLWLDDDYFQECPDTADDQTMASLLLGALSASRQEIPIPNWKQRPRRAILKRCHVKSETELVKHSKSLFVKKNSGVITFLPTRSEGKKGHVFLSDRRIELLEQREDLLGATLRAALDASEAYYALETAAFRRLT